MNSNISCSADLLVHLQYLKFFILPLLLKYSLGIEF